MTQFGEFFLKPEACGQRSFYHLESLFDPLDIC